MNFLRARHFSRLSKLALFFFCAVEVVVIWVRNDNKIIGIELGGIDKKISLVTNDTCFLHVDLHSCKICLILTDFATVSEAVYISRLKGSAFKKKSTVKVSYRKITLVIDLGWICSWIQIHYVNWTLFLN